MKRKMKAQGQTGYAKVARDATDPSRLLRVLRYCAESNSEVQEGETEAGYVVFFSTPDEARKLEDIIYHVQGSTVVLETVWARSGQSKGRLENFSVEVYGRGEAETTGMKSFLETVMRDEEHYGAEFDERETREEFERLTAVRENTRS